LATPVFAASTGFFTAAAQRKNYKQNLTNLSGATTAFLGVSAVKKARAETKVNATA
jgi:hypothetical protein